MFGQLDFMPSGSSESLEAKGKRENEKIDAKHEDCIKSHVALVGFLAGEIKRQKEIPSQNNVDQLEEALGRLSAAGPGVFLNPSVCNAFNESLGKAIEILIKEIPKGENKEEIFKEKLAA